ncbi:hypothetical protein D3C77_394060 [compost metagenome]
MPGDAVAGNITVSGCIDNLPGNVKGHHKVIPLATQNIVTGTWHRHAIPVKLNILASPLTTATEDERCSVDGLVPVRSAQLVFRG